MIDGVTGCVKCSQSSSLDLEDLTIFNVCLSFIRHVFMYCRMRTDLEKIRDPFNMVMMPMGDKRFVYRCFLLLQHRLEQCPPSWKPFACIDEETLGTTTNEVCVRSFEPIRTSGREGDSKSAIDPTHLAK